MSGSESKRHFRDAKNRVMYEAGLLSGPVWEVVNLHLFDPADPVASPGQIIQRYFAVEVDRVNGSITPFLPSRAEQDRTPKTILAVRTFQAGLDDAPPIGVSLDEMPGGGQGRVAGPGCIVPVKLRDVTTPGGRYIVCGVTSGGFEGVAVSDILAAGRTLGFATTPESTGHGADGVDHIGCLIHPL